MRGHATIDNKYIKYDMLDNISLCECPIPTVVFYEAGVFCSRQNPIAVKLLKSTHEKSKTR